MRDNFSIVNLAQTKIPQLTLPAIRKAFALIKDDILGKDYSLSLALVGEKKSREINKAYRNKDKPTNILSFELTKDKGEILLCIPLVKSESKDKAKNRGKNFKEYLIFLVIHGMLHLKGMSHSSKMDRAEEFYCKKYDQKHFSRNRSGLSHNKSSGRRISKRRKKS